MYQLEMKPFCYGAKKGLTDTHLFKGVILKNKNKKHWNGNDKWFLIMYGPAEQNTYILIKSKTKSWNCLSENWWKERTCAAY